MRAVLGLLWRFVLAGSVVCRLRRCAELRLFSAGLSISLFSHFPQVTRKSVSWFLKSVISVLSILSALSQFSHSSLSISQGPSALSQISHGSLSALPYVSQLSHSSLSALSQFSLSSLSSLTALPHFSQLSRSVLPHNLSPLPQFSQVLSHYSLSPFSPRFSQVLSHSSSAVVPVLSDLRLLPLSAPFSSAVALSSVSPRKKKASDFFLPSFARAFASLAPALLPSASLRLRRTVQSIFALSQSNPRLFPLSVSEKNRRTGFLVSLLFLSSFFFLLSLSFLTLLLSLNRFPDSSSTSLSIPSLSLFSLSSLLFSSLLLSSLLSPFPLCLSSSRSSSSSRRVLPGSLRRRGGAHRAPAGSSGASAPRGCCPRARSRPSLSQSWRQLRHCKDRTQQAYASGRQEPLETRPPACLPEQSAGRRGGGEGEEMGLPDDRRRMDEEGIGAGFFAV